MIEVSCVILGWNEYPTFIDTITALQLDLVDIPHEIIYVNNGSTDSTARWLDEHADELGIVRVDLPENMGTGRGFNEGFAIAKGHYIFYLSGDILPVIDSVTAMKRYLDEHDDADYLLINPWVSQEETKDVAFEGFGHLSRQGLGNFAGSYAMFRRKVWDTGCKLADEGIFAGPGCGFEEAEMANLMYERNFRCWIFNRPEYYHKRRDFKRSGHPEGEKEKRLDERRKWLWTRWPKQNFAITHYHQQPPERHIRRVAVVYKYYPDRPGIGGNLVLALNQICHAEHFEHGDEPSGWDNYLYVDNGDYDYFPCPEHCHPSAFWAIDMMTPQQPWRPQLSGYVERAKTFDAIYAAQPSAVAHFQEYNIEAEWLPVAANPDYHKPWAEEKAWGWAAIWHNCGERIGYVETVAKHFPSGFLGYVDGKRYSQYMSRAHCILNLSRSDELNLRVFEVMATGVPLVTDRARGLDLLFQENEHYLGFDGIEGMLGQIRWVQENPGAAEDMAQRARVEVLDKHTFYHRILSIYGKQS